jgi:hypothetical protein
MPAAVQVKVAVAVCGRALGEVAGALAAADMHAATQPDTNVTTTTSPTTECRTIVPLPSLPPRPSTGASGSPPRESLFEW